MHAIRFLHDHGLDELCARFTIRARRHGRFPNLVQLKYSQTFSPMHEPLVQECRGLIVDEADGWRVVCRAYDKFFNLGEPNAGPIDWPTARVYDKLDGSLITLYRYAGEWHAATSGLPDAAGQVNAAAITFDALFRRTWSALGYHWPDPAADGRRCFMFELLAPETRVIVAHDRPRVVLHGVRDLDTMAELEPESFAERYGWVCAPTLPLACADDCLAAAALLHPAQAEGYVVRDAAFRRVKVKSPKYVALAHMKDRMTGRRMLEIVRANESDEFLAYFPEFRPAYAAVRSAYDALCDALDADYARLAGIADQRAFAAEAGRCRYSSPLFAVRAGKCTDARAFFATATMAAVERALGLDLDRLIGPASAGAEEAVS